MRIPLRTFYRGTIRHEMGIACSINNIQFDALFDTGSDQSYLKPALMDKIRDQIKYRNFLCIVIFHICSYHGQRRLMGVSHTM
ncbi:MAG: hypothetical protein WB988_22390, partial [Candidatus Nitrosopolaris sp.]